MQGLQSDLAEIEKQVAAQNLSPDEVTRMNHERETLQRQLRETASKNAEAWQTSQDVEMSVTRTMDRFENLLSEYTTYAHQIGTLSPIADASFVGPGGVDFTIECEVSAEDVNQIQTSGKKMRDVIRPALNKYDEQIRELTRAIGEEQAGLDEESDKLVLAVEKQKSDANNKDLELAKKNSEAEAAKDVSFAPPSNLDDLTTSCMLKKLQTCKRSSASSRMKFSQCRPPIKLVSLRHNLISRQRGSSESLVQVLY
jgi:kinetochore protein NDC80